jgi:hypothetical protein
MLGNRLQSEFNSHYRRIWVQTVTLSKRRQEYRFEVTLFPIEGPYFMLFSDIVNEVSFDEVSRIIENNLELSI